MPLAQSTISLLFSLFSFPSFFLSFFSHFAKSNHITPSNPNYRPTSERSNLYPATVRKKNKPLTHSSATSTAGEPVHGHTLGLLADIVEEGKGALKLHATDSLGGLTGVLEADTEVRAPGAGALGGRNFLSSVADLDKERRAIVSKEVSLFRSFGRSGGCDRILSVVKIRSST